MVAVQENPKEIKKTVYGAVEYIIRHLKCIYNTTALESVHTHINNKKAVLRYKSNLEHARGVDYFNLECHLDGSSNTCTLQVSSSKQGLDIVKDKYDNSKYGVYTYELTAEGLKAFCVQVTDLFSTHAGIDLKQATFNGVDYAYILGSIKDTVLKTHQSVDLNFYNKSLNTRQSWYKEKAQNINNGVIVTYSGGLGDASSMSDLASKEFSIELLTTPDIIYVTQQKSTATNYPLGSNNMPVLQQLPLETAYNLIINEYQDSYALTHGERTAEIGLTKPVIANLATGLLGGLNTETKLVIEAKKDGKYKVESVTQYTPPSQPKNKLAIKTTVNNKNETIVLKAKSAGASKEEVKQLAYPYTQAGKMTSVRAIQRLLEGVTNKDEIIKGLKDSESIGDTLLEEVSNRLQTLFPYSLKSLTLTSVVTEECYVVNMKEYIPNGHSVEDLKIEIQVEDRTEILRLVYDASTYANVHFMLNCRGDYVKHNGQVLQAEKYWELKEYVLDFFKKQLQGYG